MTEAMKDMMDIDFNGKKYKPDDLATTASNIDKYIWQKEVNQYIKRKYLYKMNRIKLYGHICD